MRDIRTECYSNIGQVEESLLIELGDVPKLPPINAGIVLNSELWTAIKHIGDITLLQSRKNSYPEYMLADAIFELGTHYVHSPRYDKLQHITADAIKYSQSVSMDDFSDLDTLSPHTIRYDFYDSDDVDITKELLETELNKKIAEARAEKQEEEEIEERERRSALEKQHLWNTEGKYEFIDKDKLDFGDGVLKIDVQWKDIATLDTVDTKYSSTLRNSLSSALSYLQFVGYDGNISVTKRDGTTFTARRLPHHSHINNISLPSSRVYSLLNRVVEGEITIDNLPVYRKLSQIKIDAMDTNSLHLMMTTFLKPDMSAIQIPMSITFLSDTVVEIKMFGKTIKTKWNTIRGFLISGRDIATHIRYYTFRKWAKLFGLNRADEFRLLKSYLMVNEL